MRALAQIQQEQGAEKIGVLTLDIDPTEREEDLRRVKQVLGDPSYPFALDTGSRVALAYNVRSTDTKVYVARDGKVFHRADGMVQSESELRDLVAKLMDAGG